MNDSLYLWLIIAAWMVHDYMTWGPLSPQATGWFREHLRKIFDGDVYFHETIHTSSTWAIDEREGVSHNSVNNRSSKAPWDIAA